MDAIGERPGCPLMDGAARGTGGSVVRAARVADCVSRACVADAQSLPIVSTIASFCLFAGETWEVRAALSGRLDPRCSGHPTTVEQLIG